MRLGPSSNEASPGSPARATAAAVRAPGSAQQQQGSADGQHVGNPRIYRQGTVSGSLSRMQQLHIKYIQQATRRITNSQLDKDILELKKRKLQLEITGLEETNRSGTLKRRLHELEVYTAERKLAR